MVRQLAEIIFLAALADAKAEKNAKPIAATIRKHAADSCPQQAEAMVNKAQRGQLDKRFAQLCQQLKHAQTAKKELRRLNRQNAEYITHVCGRMV